ncbi:hypothetical protein RRG08_053035, partial [Elysia crispata]
FDPGSFESLEFVDALSEAMSTSEEMALMPVQPVLSNAQYILFLFYLNTISIPICIFGILANFTNILVFYKMGFSFPTNINLFCLASGLTDTVLHFNCKFRKSPCVSKC